MVDIDKELAQLQALETRLLMFYAQLHAAGWPQADELRDVVNRRAALAVRLALAAMRQDGSGGH